MEEIEVPFTMAQMVLRIPVTAVAVQLLSTRTTIPLDLPVEQVVPVA
jgi:hypothetical protein